MQRCDVVGFKPPRTAARLATEAVALEGRTPRSRPAPAVDRPVPIAPAHPASPW